MKFQMTKEQSLVCKCMRHESYLDKNSIQELYFDLDDAALFKEAFANGVESIVGRALIVSVGESSIPDHWKDSYSIIESKISSYMRELDKAADILAQADVKMAALKNSGITRGLYSEWGSCPMGDLDVLVSPDDFIKAHQALTNAGYQLKFRSVHEEDTFQAAVAGGGAEYSVTLDDGSHLWFELQFRPIAGRWIQESQEPKADDLIDRATPARASNVLILSPEDNLIQVCLHTAKHSFVRAPGFRLHTDVDRVVSSQKVNWESVIQQVSALHIKTPVYISLAMAKSLLQTPIPNHVLEALSPGKLKIRIISKWLEQVGIFYPDDKKWNRLTFILFVCLLFDSPKQLIEGTIPSVGRLKTKYGFNNGIAAPVYFLKYIFDLLFKRSLS